MFCPHSDKAIKKEINNGRTPVKKIKAICITLMQRMGLLHFKKKKMDGLIIQFNFSSTGHDETKKCT
jgi:hypothetical protein